MRADEFDRIFASQMILTERGSSDRPRKLQVRLQVRAPQRQVSVQVSTEARAEALIRAIDDISHQGVTDFVR